MRTMTRVLIAVGVLAFAAFVWPTLYRPIAIHVPANGLYTAARQNRITGTVEWLAREDARFGPR